MLKNAAAISFAGTMVQNVTRIHVLSAGERRSFTANTIIRDPSWRRKDAKGALRISPQDAESLGLSETTTAVVTGIAYMDGHGLANAREFAEVVRRHPQLERVVCGHLHRPIQARVGGTLASTAPSTAHQVALDLGDGNPLMFTMEPPACQLHVWRPDTGLVSHTSYIGDFDGPYLFANGSKRSR